MSDIDAIYKAIEATINLFFLYYSGKLLINSPKIEFVFLHVKQEVELKWFDEISLRWFLMQNSEVLSNAMKAYKNNESIAAQIFDIIDDDDSDDDGDLAIYKEDLAKS